MILLKNNSFENYILNINGTYHFNTDKIKKTLLLPLPLSWYLKEVKIVPKSVLCDILTI